MVWFFFFVVFYELTEPFQTIGKTVHFPFSETELTLTE